MITQAYLKGYMNKEADNFEYTPPSSNYGTYIKPNYGQNASSNNYKAYDKYLSIIGKKRPSKGMGLWGKTKQFLNIYNKYKSLKDKSKVKVFMDKIIDTTKGGSIMPNGTVFKNSIEVLAKNRGNYDNLKNKKFKAYRKQVIDKLRSTGAGPKDISNFLNYYKKYWTNLYENRK